MFDIKIKEGDVVYHKSNDSIKMIVVQIHTPTQSRNEYIRCRWVHGNGNINVHVYDFRPYELVKIYENI